MACFSSRAGAVNDWGLRLCRVTGLQTMGRVIRTFEYQSLDLQRSVRWISWRLEERRAPYHT